MEKFCIIGVDLSKKKLDFCVMLDGQVVNEQIVSNDVWAVMAFLKELKTELGLENANLLVCAEHTGQYTYPLSCACKISDCKLWLENPSQIKFSSGVQRGKNDKVDARRIALYACRFSDKLRVHKPLTEEIEQLKQLEAERSLYITDMGKYKAQLKDQKGFMPEKMYLQKAHRLEKVIKQLEASIQIVDQLIQETILSNQLLNRQMELLCSVEGVGKIVATSMIIITQAFTCFDDPRKFNCYAGLAPFCYISGSSQYSRNRVSHRADKHIKSLLHMAAIAVIRKKDSELKDYFIRKKEEGKNSMTVINAIRAKIVARMFAVIRNNQIYKYSLT